jgi:phosphoribosylanthranilate isomerase
VTIPKIKICGICRLEDARCAIQAGADMIGFVFFRKSPRYREPEYFKRVIDTLKREGMKLPTLVGVFVNETIAVVSRLARMMPLDAVQLHGTETDEDAQALRRSGLLVFKAFQIADASSVREFENYKVDAYLCDTPAPEQWGGTGQTFDHALLGGAARRHNLILAGGLKAENFAKAIRMVHPWAVDVSSGVEKQAGIKDPDKIAAFIQAVRASTSTAKP